MCDGYLWKQQRSIHRCLDKWYENSKSKQWQLRIVSKYSCQLQWIIWTFRCLDLGLRLVFRKQHNISETLFFPPICGEMGWSHVLSSVRQEELFSITGRKQIQLPKHCVVFGVPADGQCPDARHTYWVFITFRVNSATLRQKRILKCWRIKTN